MLRRLLILAGLSLVAFGSQAAKADLLLEPYAAYEFGTLKSTNPGAGGDYKYTVNGPSLGARVGFAMPLLWFALDGNLGSENYSVSDQPAGGGGVGGTTSRTTIFADAGVKIPFFQAYLGYGFYNNWVNHPSTGSDQTYSGNAIKFGAGFTGLPFIALNLEYMLSTFNKYKDASGDHDIGSGNTISAASASTVLLTVSAPFRL